MPRSKLEISLEKWDVLRKRSKRRVILEIVERVLNNVVVPLQQPKRLKTQKVADVNIATDFTERLLGDYLKKANAAYAAAALEVRRLGGRASRTFRQDNLALTTFDVIGIRVEFREMDLRTVRRKLREVRKLLRKV